MVFFKGYRLISITTINKIHLERDCVIALKQTTLDDTFHLVLH